MGIVSECSLGLPVHLSSPSPQSNTTTPPVATTLLDQSIKLLSASLLDMEEDNGWNNRDPGRIFPEVVPNIPQPPLSNHELSHTPFQIPTTPYTSPTPTAHSYSNTPNSSVPSSTAASTATSNTSPASQDHVPTLSALDLIATVSDMPLVDHEGRAWDMEDPDLLPTIEDWALVYQEGTANGTIRPIWLSSDGDSFMRNFFLEPPFYRLVQCAMAAFEWQPPLPAYIAMNYYKRARKAVIRAMNEKPTHKTVQAFYWLALFISWKGQPDLARPFLKTALDLIKVLQLDIDPDDSPWLYQLNLSPRQKEDRRRAFWATYSHFLKEKVLSNLDIEVCFNADRIKEPSAVNDPYPIFGELSILKPLCELYSAIVAIKNHFLVAPSSINNLLYSDSLSSLRLRLQQVHAKMPTDCLLHTTSPESLTPSDKARFIIQQNTLVKAAKDYNFSFNTAILSSICLLNRPILFLSKQKCCRPMFIGTDVQNVISGAINQSLDAAHRILNIMAFFEDPDCFQDSTPYVNSYHSLLEAMIVFWFTICRMDSVWWAVLGRKRHDWVSLKERLLQAVDYVSRLDKESVERGVGAVPPVLTIMKEMLKDIEEQEVAFAQGGNSAGRQDEGVSSVTLGMKIVSLDGSENEVVTAEPKAFLGLLGMEVKGIRWPGPSEESWRLFWKLYS
ncbi:UNVERIFIED_CONTAM: hypothetical protein HDU68_000278 [Siphonaria sp. JEL0065]|nr:hypothetical protein HDU68_000278 [Siphonaria sp. JEL0065]